MKCERCDSKSNIKHFPIHPVSRYGYIALCDKCFQSSKKTGIPCRVNKGAEC
jgi:hypothetical protein